MVRSIVSWVLERSCVIFAASAFGCKSLFLILVIACCRNFHTVNTKLQNQL